MADATRTADVLAAAIFDDRLVAALDAPAGAGLDPDDDIVVAAVSSVTSIGALARRERSRLLEGMCGASVIASGPVPPERQQRPLVTLDVDPTQLDAAMSALCDLGYQPWRQLGAGAWESYRRTRTYLPLSDDGGGGAQLRLRWRAQQPRSGRLARATRRLQPSPGDWSAVDLPARAWPIYHAVRIGRLGLRAVGVSKAPTVHGPHLPTPTTLVEPLLEFAGVTSDDLLVDVGCGDGRVLVTAAQTIGCHGLGVDHDQHLVDEANRRAVAAGVSHMVEFVRSDVTDADFSDATAAFVFLPAAAVDDTLALLHRAMPTGSAVVAHEQDDLVTDLEPEKSAPVFNDGGLTVAHRWTIGTP